MTGYKQLCAELVDELEGWVAYGDEIDIANAHVLIDRARAALAEPEPEGPTDEKLLQVFDTACLSEGGMVDEIHLRGLRAVAALFETKSELTPMSVSEPPPKPEDRNSKGECWWFCLECPGEYSHWILAKEVYCNPTHWLPADALPLPS